MSVSPLGTADKREIVWMGIETSSLEYCTVINDGNSWLFKGIVVLKVKQEAFAVNYEISTDMEFNTRRALIIKYKAGSETRVEIGLREGTWFVDGIERTDLQGCKDIDLEVSPVTNTLPIRRTPMSVGQKINLTAVWVRFPTLEVTTLQQSYERLDERRYLYRSRQYSAELEVDGFGLVTRYGNVWKQVG